MGTVNWDEGSKKYLREVCTELYQSAFARHHRLLCGSRQPPHHSSRDTLQTECYRKQLSAVPTRKSNISFPSNESWVINECGPNITELLPLIVVQTKSTKMPFPVWHSLLLKNFSIHDKLSKTLTSPKFMLRNVVIASCHLPALPNAPMRECRTICTASCHYNMLKNSGLSMLG